MAAGASRERSSLRVRPARRRASRRRSGPDARRGGRAGDPAPRRRVPDLGRPRTGAGARGVPRVPVPLRRIPSDRRPRHSLRRVCLARRPLPGRAPAGRARPPEADRLPRAHGRRHREARGMEARPVHARRGERVLLRTRHVRRQEHRRAPHGDVSPAEGRGVRPDARPRPRLHGRRGNQGSARARPRREPPRPRRRRVRPERRRGGRDPGRGGRSRRRVRTPDGGEDVRELRAHRAQPGRAQLAGRARTTRSTSSPTPSRPFRRTASP